MSDSVIGKEINGYRIQKVLGRGGMGVVYKADELALSRPVALKCLNQQLADDESFLRRFRSEARAIARINSPYIVQVYTLSETEIGLVIVMEYVEGGTLKQRITPGKTDWRELLPLIQQMLTALQHAHNAEVIHRDIKPQNILVSDIILAHGIRVKMTDFGLAKVNTSGDPTRTITQGGYGTLPYMSPEQVKGHGQVDHRSDIYSVGMTCYEMLAGRLPFDENSSEYTIMRTIVEEDLPELGAFASDMPKGLRDIVMKALAKDPEDRFQSAEQMQEAIKEFKEFAAEMQEAMEEFTEFPARAHSGRESSAIPPDRESPEKDSTTQDATKESHGGTRQSPSASTTPSVSSWTWRVAGAGVVLALLLAGAWYFTVGSLTFPTEPTAGVERSALDGKTSSEGGALEKSSGNAPEETATGKTPDKNTADEDTSDEATASTDASGGEPTGAASPGTPTPDTESPGGQAPNDQSEQSAADTEEVQTGPPQDLPSPIAALLDIDDASVLKERIGELEEEGQLTRGDEPGDFFTPGECYIFVMEAGSVGAVLGPETNGVRIELRSGENVEDWSSRYSNSFTIWVDPVSN